MRGRRPGVLGRPSWPLLTSLTAPVEDLVISGERRYWRAGEDEWSRPADQVPSWLAATLRGWFIHDIRRPPAVFRVVLAVHCLTHYLRDAVLERHQQWPCVCLSVRLSVLPSVLSKRLKRSIWIMGQRLPSAYPALRYINRNSLIYKIRALLSGTLSQTLDLKNFAGNVTYLNFCSFNYISEMTEARVVTFCVQVGYSSHSLELTNHP